MLARKQIHAFLELAKNRLEGKWLVIGGTVLPMMGYEVRPTMDIDFVCLEQDSSNEQQLQLMQVAEDLELPVETINSAGAFFVKKLGDISGHVVELAKGKAATIYRPDAWLFFKLKLSRLSENDLADCLAFAEHCRGEVSKEKKSLLKLIATAIGEDPSPAKLKRLEKLQGVLRKT